MTITQKKSGSPLIGEVYQGKVKTIKPFGAFVTFGFPKDGLVHISEISNERIQDINRVLSVGDDVFVKVIGFDRDGRFKLSIKQADSDSDGDVEPAAQPVFGEVYEGSVVKIEDFGAFINYGFARDGMVHISEIAPNRIQNVSDVLKVKDIVKVRFLGFDSKGRTRLSIKQALNDNMEKPEIGEFYDGLVADVMPFGAFVKFSFGEGLVHVSEMIMDTSSQDPQDVLAVGEKVQVKFLGFDERGRIKLSMRA